VAPVVYAHIEANLAHAEEEMNERCYRHYTEGFRALRKVEPDIDAIWASDVDGDGIVDMLDGEPWIAEDKDGFQDGDGIPEPKPYPVLEDVLFCDNCDTLSKEAQAYLRGVADMLYDGYKEVTVVLSGHTSSTASNEYNLGLSQRRVEAVKSYLLANGVKQDVTCIVTSHHGEEALKVAPDKSAKDQALNRRVEIMLDSPDPVSPYCR
ncbi:MAG TPA: OmpA family protein, partial [Candidatus Hydrogenedentes bacterium]|nr:OmpA family protein [Candidatus Hydrogenedentota bacterium]